MKNKHLICLGFAKSGTTLLNYLLSKTNEFITPLNNKEIRYFLPYKFTNKINDYLSYYSINPKNEFNNKVLFEATPPYIHTAPEKFQKIMANIKNLIDNPKILICLRHPVYRSFSHYIHNINKHFSYKGFSFTEEPKKFSIIYRNSFFDAINNEEQIATKYHSKIKYLKSIFGMENIFFFVLEKDIRDFANFYQRLCSFLDIEHNSYFVDKTVPRIGSGKLIPQYFYADKQDLLIQSKESFYRLNKGELLICNDNENMLCKDISPNIAYQVSNSQHFWTKTMTSKMAQKLTKTYFADDIDQVSKLIKSNCDISFYKDYNFKDISISLSQPKHGFLQKKLTRIF